MKNKLGSISLANNIHALEEIARFLGKRTTYLNLIDPQVGHSSWDWRDSLSSKQRPSDFFSRKLSFKANNFRVTLRVNDEFLVADIKGAFGSSVVCSFVNNKVFEPSRKLASNSIRKSFGCKVYCPALNAESTMSLLQNPSFQKLVKALHLTEKESLHIGNGYASLYLQRLGCNEVLETLGILYNLLAMLPLDNGMPANFDDLPDNLKKLIPLMKRWAISDDSDRADRIKKASSATLTRLLQAVSPDFDAINHYLDAFGNKPLPEHAILLGALAEYATEAQLTLKARLARREKA